MNQEPITMLAVGDVWINRKDPEGAFTDVAPVLRAADIAFCNGEAVYTRRGINTYSLVENQPCDPDCIKGIAYAGFNVVNLAHNPRRKREGACGPLLLFRTRRPRVSARLPSTLRRRKHEALLAKQ